MLLLVESHTANVVWTEPRDLDLTSPVTAGAKAPASYVSSAHSGVVVTGMADGYWRIAGKPACTLLHCGPGLANGLTNLHNARRARSGIVNVVGDQATYHRPYDPPLTADTDAMARTVSAWVRISVSAKNVGRDAAEAVQTARTYPGRIATLILPSDASWAVSAFRSIRCPCPIRRSEASTVDEVARVLRAHGAKTLVLIGGRAGSPNRWSSPGAWLALPARPLWRSSAWRTSRADADVLPSSACLTTPTWRWRHWRSSGT